MNRDEDRELRRRADREAERALFEHREQLQPPAGSAERSWAALQRRIAAGEAAPVLAEPVRARGGRRVVIAVLAAAAVLALWQWRPQALRRGEAVGAVEAILMRVDPDGSRRAAWAAKAAKGGVGEAGSGDRSGAGTGVTAAGSGDRSGEAGSGDGAGAAGSGDRSGAAGSGDRSGAAGSGDRSGAAGSGDRAAGGAVLKDRSTGDLAVELAQVRAAGEAVRAGRGEEALAAAEAYLRAHPLGAFAPEARLHQAEALCLLGREAAARAAAEAFLRELPDSPLRARVAGVCAATK